MRQVAKRLKDGSLELVDVPDPAPGPGAVSVRVEASVLSAGTERATLDVARKGLIAKARARPDQARQVLERMRSDGVRSTLDLVRQRLEELGPLGYSAAGVVVEAGAEARGLAPGDRVAIAGGGFASHAELDVVPSLLCAGIPDGVSAEDAAFATLGAIAMNGFRRAEVQVGSTVAVIGLGLIGQLAVRIARAAGCRVLGVDLSPELVELARAPGADAVLRSELDQGSRFEASADAVLVCAATDSNDPALAAARLARDRGRVVIVGDVRMDLPRAPFYDKELDLRLSRSYGPGRYDPNYELHGLDYPIGHVRWTEQRNMEAFLGLVADGKVTPSELVTHRFDFGEAERAFELLQSGARVVGVVLRYTSNGAASASLSAEPPGAARPRTRARASKGASGPRLGLAGAGSFATGTLIPGMREAGFELAAIASASGLSAESARRQFGFDDAHSSVDELIGRDDLDLVAIATRHDSHAELAARALEAGHAVYVEKPLALDEAGLRRVIEAQRTSGAPLIVGFNRRFAPLAVELRNLPGPRLMAYRVNAGPVPGDHWTNDLARGGGRLKGEGCHFIDFLCDQAGSDPVTVSSRGFVSRPDLPLAATDNFSIEIAFADGGVGTLHYAADSPVGPGKERFETSSPGVYAEIDDYRRGRIWRGRNKDRLGASRQDKGFSAQFASLAAISRGDAEPHSPQSFWLSSLVTLAAARSLESGRAEPVTDPGPDPHGAPGEPGRREVEVMPGGAR